MKNILKYGIVSAFIFTALVWSGVVFFSKLKENTSIKKENSNNVQTVNDAHCVKEENCCTKDSDCKYGWFTGGCYTQEYVSKIMKEAEKTGVHYGEARPRENVTCTCEENKCITHG